MKYMNINNRWVKELNVIPETKGQKESIGGTLFDINCSNILDELS